MPRELSAFILGCVLFALIGVLAVTDMRQQRDSARQSFNRLIEDFNYLARQNATNAALARLCVHTVSF